MGKTIFKTEKFHIIAHFAALFTIIVWGATFISTKILLKSFAPVEILILRFIIGFFALFIIYPHRLKNSSLKEEGLFALAGLFGICLYYLLENISLVYTMASNCGVIMSFAPFFAVILSKIFIKQKERLQKRFFLGFFIAITGICFICSNGAKFELNPLGDVLALLAAFVWGCYSIVSKKISAFKYPLVLVVRKTFFYGILFMLPACILLDANFSPGHIFNTLKNPAVLFNIIFLGLFASALCFLTWNYALKILGVVKTSVYLYLVPVITVFASVLILKEPFTIFTLTGTFLTIFGLFISKRK